MSNEEEAPIILIPLGGIGKRFSDVGHSMPKPLVKALGQPVLYWLLRSLPRVESVRMIVIPYHPDLKKHRFEDQLRHDFPEIPFHFLPLKGNTKGAADTMRITLESLASDLPDAPIISLDGDNFYTQDLLSMWGGRDALVTFQDFGSQPIYSYVRTNEDGRVVEIKEKVKISNFACTGAYGFSSWRQLLKYCLKTLSNDENMQKNEFYISSVIALMIREGSVRFDKIVLPKESYICLGTPLQLRTFCNDFPRRDALSGEVTIKPRRFCFDLDNTLVTFPRVEGDYSTVEPITYMIDYVKYLKNFDHTIIIYTSRRMTEHKGNMSAAMADIGKVTFDTLEEFGIPYDEICFGKPVADCYIDSSGVSAFDDIEKALGFYQTQIKPRVFNDVAPSSALPLIRKASANRGTLEGEIYYYNHIPLSVKDCFPIMVGYDQGNSWYEVERIEGTPVSNLFLSKELTLTGLSTIMGTLHRIHSATDLNETGDIKIYDNYAPKLQKRFDSYPGYGRFENASEVFASLVEHLECYEAEGRGHCSVIHGDPVMSNIIINSFGKVKLIDMRGKVGETLTIRGDELYDWAKLYQSLIGYDEILQNRSIPESYRESLLKCFWGNLKELSPEINPDDVKRVTQSLLFSLIPLHTAQEESEKQDRYYGLIEKCLG